MSQLTDEDKEFINLIKSQLGIVADISRAEVLLYGPLHNGKTQVLLHAHPHSVSPAYLKSYTGVEVSKTEMPVVIKALDAGRRQKGSEGIFSKGFSVVIEVWPIYALDRSGRVIGAVSIDTSLLEHERQRRRSRVFQKTLCQLQNMSTKGLLKNAKKLSPFGEPEGLMVINKEGYIKYTSGVAASLYRRLGYLDSLVDRHIDDLVTYDGKLFSQAKTSLQCIERETEDGGRYWVRKVIPLIAKPRLKEELLRILNRSKALEEFDGVLMIIRDVTEERRQKQEMRIKGAMIQEVHHRVKNNLQTIAALLRIQSRRVKNQEAASALKDAIKRILSVAVIHEFLSDQDAWTINIKDVCQRIIGQTREGIVWEKDKITFQLNGPPIWLPARQATACALVINELLQNALEHGLGDRRQGTISITLVDEGDHVVIIINDDGHGLPDNFDPQNLNSLGLQIANTLVTEDLQGSLSLTNDNGTTAKIAFPKAIFEGEDIAFN
jgi:two-component sensor histidine kinase